MQLSEDQRVVWIVDAFVAQGYAMLASSQIRIGVYQIWLGVYNL